MSLHISRVQIRNFRNFRELDVQLADKAVIVGENASGKTNFIHALRLILDPSLPDSARKLTEDDFWDGLDSPMENGEEITITIDLRGFEENDALLSILSDYQIPGEDVPTTRITYKFAPMQTLQEEGTEQGATAYDFVLYGGEDEAQVFGYRERKWLPLMVLPALRDAETDLSSWRKSPLRPLLERVNVTREQLQEAADKIDEATEEIISLDELRNLSDEIETRLEQMIGEYYSVAPQLGVAGTDAMRLLRSLRLFLDGEKQRTIGETSLGICNVLYLTLLVLELERREAAAETACTIIAIEEPEAHLHPHLQRLVYHDFLRRESPVLLTTHSPNIVSVSPLRSLVLLRNAGDEEGCKAASTSRSEITEIEVQDLERYLDATRGEILFAKGVILVEGHAELYIVPMFASLLERRLDERGISVCSVHGTDFLPYTKLLSAGALDIPHVVLTDGDPYAEAAENDGQEVTKYRGSTRGARLASFHDPDRSEELDNLIRNNEWEDLDEILEGLGIFVGIKTLEIDLADEGYDDEFLTTITELGAGTRRQERFSEALQSDTDEDLLTDEEAYIIKVIESYGKGRFAQRLTPKLAENRIPNYIRNAINHISELVTGE